MAETLATETEDLSQPRSAAPQYEYQAQPKTRQTAPAPRVSVRKAEHSYGSSQVLRGVDLRIEAGEVYGLLGPNGAGKTTLMRAISARLRPDKGTVRINGRNPLRNRRARLAIGFVPQEIALYGHLTVRENLEVLGRFAGVKGRVLKDAVNTVLEQAELSDRSQQLCNTLSGGYQRRVNICASLLHNPGVLILDEPTVGIDIKAREAVHQLIESVRARGAAVLLTTHDLEQAQALCDRIGIMVEGKIGIEGRPDNLLQQAFGGDMEVLVTLLRAPSQLQTKTLAHYGLLPSSNPLVWFKRAEPGHANADDLLEKLTETGIATKEVRVRQPDLSSLFVAVLGRGEQA